VDQVWLLTPLVEDSANAVFLAERMYRADELDRQPVLPRQPLRVLPDLLAQRLGEARMVKQPDVVCPQIGGFAPIDES